MLVKVKSGNVIKLIDINTDTRAKDVRDFICSKFGIAYNISIKFLDRDKVPIEEDQIVSTIKQFGSCSCFLLEILDKENKFNDKAISSSFEAIGNEALLDFLKEGDGAHILEEYNQTKTLSDASRRILVREAVNFLRKVCGNYPSRQQKIALAKAIIANFPVYKCSASEIGGIDLFYNPAENSGYLVSKLKNFNRKRRTNLSQSSSESNTDGRKSTAEEFDVDFFRNCVVGGNSEDIKQKLKTTLNERIRYCTLHLDVLKAFPIFRYDPSLISFDFELRYNRLIANSLITSWRSYLKFTGDVLKDTIGSCLIPEWFIEIKPFLHLLRLLPSFTLRSKENKQKRVNFESTINKFINFQNINTPIDDFELHSKQPTIVASGKSTEEIVQYFILIDGKALHVPITYTFIEVFDLYFKSFYVFHIEFDPALSNFLKFFSKFIYKVEPNVKCSNRVLEIYMKFKSKIDAERSVI
ncbi:uncharacterized protein LOC126760006 isoform X2 [Bactrocera neohumeralis]|uniref:uncharacterized protein LOC120769348 isoform X2 n=1 Tax=Bactrocera tryoni TaxID=59916 RepID=UPI001A95F657|nr:uncharacterized protein LOC120769348 isoform X2 [Bactrocera tryoni]XP_050331291.1 uncharacterized protein LOC126760006 isoform X2 [Bactrocera neohumeralis]